MLIPDGELRYEIRRGGELLALETESLTTGAIRGTRRAVGSTNLYEVEAELDDSSHVRRIVVRYSRGPFVRTAVYDATGDFMRGTINAVAGRNNLTAKLGRYRDVEAGLVIFRALTIAHIRERGQSRWTGRVVSIDPNTLVAATVKQSCRMRGTDSRAWIYEQRMGDSEEIELDEQGRVLRGRDNQGLERVLVSPPR
jgi:hypothetical protein